ncbi:MAG TPA: DNA topoisomerase, partial [Trichocoleus sp.]
AAPFCESVRQYLQQHDPTNLPLKATHHRAVKGSQEAHEAIRPTHVEHLPQSLQQLTGDEARLYALIWNRAVASQCAPARLRKTRIVTQSGEAYWEARGQVLEFPGYTRYWNNISADTVLPALTQGQPLTLEQAQADPKQTQPPPRYSEPNLVKLMEQKGIGRPSTYAPTIKTLRQREYVELQQGKLKPTALGLELDSALEQLLPDLIQPEFTAQMETALDAIATGEQEWQSYLIGWHRSYFAPAIERARRSLPSLLMNSLVESAAKFGAESGAELGAGLGVRSQIPSSSDVSEKAAALASQGPTRAKSAKSTSTQSGSTKSGSVKPSSTKSSSTKAASTGSTAAKTAAAKSTAAKSSSAKTTKTKCPTCGEAMSKVPSRSKQLKAKHFLKCSATGCGTVMFWNAKAKRYELPHTQRQATQPDMFTDHPCPVCGALLERYAYTKEGQEKVMLRCSLLENRRGKCKEVAFFQSRGEFWSPKFGTLKLPQPQI